ncbi:MAG: uroporphyrin-III C-methyltransferase/precorrin-2 dehydrogenase/sirohydrochlorin ferrochelatase [Motiliproteus sp.]|jgi:uroporphyrin-III C-methyltransferase/precorrin-2 dehydrogenase/sirohydrochlorin ferrochelatase
MDYLPLFFDLKTKPCLLIGGGAVALRKAELLCRAGARITVVAPQLREELLELVQAHQGTAIQAPYSGDLLEGMTLVVAATDDPELNQQVHQDAQNLGIPVNVVDQPALCDFIFPAIVDRSPLMIAISSGGSAPVLARLVRARLEALIPHAYGQLGRLMGQFRERVKTRFSRIESRRSYWEQVLYGPVPEQLATGQQSQALRWMEDLLERADDSSCGEVYLVGAGPGDPDLLTFKALRMMQQADVVLYDRLVSPRVMELCRRDAERIYVGKERDNHSVPQEGINQLLVDLARQGKKVLRLKGGDPFIFGRGGEELEMLAEQQIPFQVVPGITAASACACYAGIPLTHRGYAQSVKFVTGQLKNRSADLNWPELVHANQTIVFYMGLHRLGHLASQLIAHGKDPATPVALVQAGSTPQQKVVTGTLKTIEQVLKENPLSPPSLIIVGEVVELHKKLAWYKGHEEASHPVLSLRE